MDPTKTKFEVAVGQDESVATLKELIARFERGEIAVAALRAYNTDGTWEDIAIGGDTDEERAEALAYLRSMKDRGH